MEIVNKKIGEIRPYPRNAKEHKDNQVQQIADSIQEFGFNQPIVVDKENVIIVGHGRYEAAKLLNMEEVPTVTLNLSESKAKAYRLADNKLNESKWFMDLVTEELKLLSDDEVDLTGFDRDLILDVDEDDDDIPNLPEKTDVKKGDVYEIGKHRIMCGDSTNEEDINKIMGGKSAKLIFSSPPYNMNSSMYETYKDNKGSQEYIDFNIDVIKKYKQYLKGFIFWNISYNKNARTEFIEIIYKIIKECGMTFLELIVWNKKKAMPITSKNMLTRQYEDIFLVGDDESISSELELFCVGKNDEKAWFNKRTEKGVTNYWEVGTNKIQLENHKACFPVELPLKGLKIMTKEEDIVIDPFLGSGQTLIACEKSNRICYGMEMDPLYIDVVIRRYIKKTGQTKIKKNGQEIEWTGMNSV